MPLRVKEPSNLYACLLGFAIAFALPGSVYADPPRAAAEIVVPADLQARFYANAIQVKEQMLDDYKTMLKVYYELKKKSSTPDEFPNPAYNPSLAEGFSGEVQRSFLQRTLPKAEEFDIGMYREFEHVLDKDPRLAGNTFVFRMKELGMGQANDVFQRLHAYALQDFISREPLDPDTHKRLRIDIATSIRDYGILEADQVFNEVSKTAGYPNNKSVRAASELATWREPVELKARELATHLNKIGFVAPPTRSAEASCADGFSKLAK